jgi:LmbE family N-acetylglucosaminyl deacetylase
MPRAVALSPHLDDAAFSCGGTLARLAQAGWEVTLCTVFTASIPEPRGFALACQLDKGLPAEADYMALRRAEDAAACSALGAAPRWLPFAEAPHRGYNSAAALFGPPAPGDAIMGPLLASLSHHLRAGPLDLVLAPQAIGGHVDHVLLVEALRLALPPGLPILWWTDWPYAARPAAIPARPSRLGFDALPEHRARATPPPACGLRAYASQLGFFQFGPDRARRRPRRGRLSSFHRAGLPATA